MVARLVEPTCFWEEVWLLSAESEGFGKLWGLILVYTNPSQRSAGGQLCQNLVLPRASSELLQAAQ